MFYTVSEKWSYNHDNDFRILLHFKLDEMEKNGQFIKNKLTNDRSMYKKDGSPIKIFVSLEAANNYIDWIKTYHTPDSMTIDFFSNEEDLNSFFKSITSTSSEYDRESGPNNKDHIDYANKHNLQVDLSKYIDH